MPPWSMPRSSPRSTSGWQTSTASVFVLSSKLTCFFFFQAEDGIRDLYVTWSSDVCSSDLFIVTFDDITELQLAQRKAAWADVARSEEHTSELQSRRDLVCRLLLEKKKK